MDVTPEAIQQGLGVDINTATQMYDKIKADPKGAAAVWNQLQNKGTPAAAAGTGDTSKGIATPDSSGVTTSPVDMSTPTATALDTSSAPPSAVGAAAPAAGVTPPPSPGTPAPAAPIGAAAQAPAAVSAAPGAAAVGPTGPVAPPTAPDATAAPAAAPDATAATPAATPAAAEDPRLAFVKQYTPAAVIAAKKNGTDPAQVLGQWGLETGWGQHVVKDTNNLGNIKDFAGRADSVEATDNQTGTKDKYRKFSSPEEYANEYGDTINRKYPGVVGTAGKDDDFAAGLVKGGYATDKDYGTKVKSAVADARKLLDAGGNIAVARQPSRRKRSRHRKVRRSWRMTSRRCRRWAGASSRTRTRRSIPIRQRARDDDTPSSQADVYANQAKVYAKYGDMDNAKKATDLYLSTKADEVWNHVDNVMKSDMSDDAKIGAIARDSGIKVYNAGNGQYVVPALSGGPNADGSTAATAPMR